MRGDAHVRFGEGHGETCHRKMVRRSVPTPPGLEREVAVERKSLDDYVHTVIRDRDRFRRELQILQTYASACVVVEASLDDIFTGDYRSGAHPNSILGATLSIIVDYGIPVYFCSNRQIARRFVMEFLLRYYQKGKDSCNTQYQIVQQASEERLNGSTTPPQILQQDDS
ncbi:MAG: ERCC4 domain-containing protein, partial [Armatimonadota bacterium]